MRLRGIIRSIVAASVVACLGGGATLVVALPSSAAGAASAASATSAAGNAGAAGNQGILSALFSRGGSTDPHVGGTGTGKITGKVTNSSGTPLTTIQVYAYTPANTAIGTGVTTSTGTY